MEEVPFFAQATLDLICIINNTTKVIWRRKLKWKLFPSPNERKEKKKHNDMKIWNLPTTCRCTRALTFGSVDTWHSYAPASRAWTYFICNVQNLSGCFRAKNLWSAMKTALKIKWKEKTRKKEIKENYKLSQITWHYVYKRKQIFDCVALDMSS